MMNWRRLLNQKWLIGLSLLTGLGVLLFLILARGTKSTLTEQLLKRKLTIARAEASNITSFFQQFGDDIRVFAHLSSIEHRDASTVQDMDTFVELRGTSGMIWGIALTDENGVVQFNSNVSGTRDIGALLSDRDYFVWAKDQSRSDGEYFVGQPVASRLGASKGEMIVPVAAAVYQDDVFAGVMVSAVKLQPLAERFLEFMKVSDATEVYLVGEQGVIFYSDSTPDVVGSNIFELSKYTPFSDKTVRDQLKNALKTSEEGTLQTKTHSIAYSPTLLVNQKWLLVMTTPGQQVEDLTLPIYVRQISILLFAIITSLLFGVVVAKEIKLKRVDQSLKKED